ncbi:protein SABRE-like [Impatiens glandulifera]|uniref:protein SABRE-like n=1 Tax=Impatiens glandulifera TaxID=253017 RepID=UPI001FB0FAC4|nr:protein SABRE-like [Impatiens glandulifera]XP_047320033.1 protein SABRE-like [Impatiens glandulifera]
MGPFSFFFAFLVVSTILWILITFAAQLLAQILSRVMGASVHFSVGGLKSLRNINVQFKKGAIESVSVGEIKLSFRQSLIKLEPKVRLLIHNLEVVMRPPTKSSPKTRSGRSRSSGSGKLMAAANAARFLSVSITELVVKTPKAIAEVKELGVNISKDEGSLDVLVKLHLLLISLHLVDPQASSDRSSNFNHGGYISRKTPLVVTERTTPFHCEEFSLSCEFGPNREDGISVRTVDISTGEIAINLNEEILVKKKTSSQVLANETEILESNSDSIATKKPSKLSALTKHASLIPEKFSFSLPTFNVKCVHKGHNLVIDNNIMGMQLKSVKSKSIQDGGESTHFDIQLDFSEIHLFREDGVSIVEILKLDVLCSSHIPLEPTLPIRSDIDVKLGDSQFNLVLSRLKPLLLLKSSKPKKMVLQEGTPNPKRQHSTESKAIIWTCSVSAPEMAIMLYDLSGSPLYHGCVKSSRFLANNTSSTGVSAHMSLGELNLLMDDEYHEFVKEGLFGVVTNTATLFHIAKVSLDWGRKDIESSEDGSKSKLVLSVDVSGMGLHFTLKRVESLVTIGLSLKSLLKGLSSSNKKSSQNQGKSVTSSGKGVQLINFNLERCSVSYNGDFGLDNVVVPDPKRVNYGSQGGRVLISVLADGTPRTANVMSTVSEECKILKYMTSIDIFHFSLTVNKEKQSMQTEVENAKSIYQEYLEHNEPGTKVSLLDIQNLKFVRRSGGLKDAANCSLFSAVEISVRWEPDVHIALFELMLRMKLLVHNIKAQEAENSSTETTTIVGHGQEEPSIEPAPYEKQQKKKDSLFAVDVEFLNISADAGDGVEATVQVQSIFSENASIGVLLEGLVLTFNEARVFKSSRMQISRIPNVSRVSSEGQSDGVTTWDWVIQGLDVHVCLPYRLQLRAIDDSVEDMLRALKLVTAAKTMLIFPWKKESAKPKKPSSTKFGSVRFCIRKLTAEIEEEPLQGWLDEHYHLMKNEAWELAVRLKYLDELASRAMEPPETADINDPSHEGKILYKGEEIDIHDASVLQSMRDDIYKESFKSYYQACNNIVPTEGSGAYKIGFQSGFKLSKNRSFLISIVATELDVSLTKIGGGDSGMVEVVQKLDPTSKEDNIPFSRLYGSNILLRAGSLAVKLRDYTYPLFFGTSGRCEGRIVLAQQATSFQPQIQQNVFVGRWRKVCMFRSASGTTPPMKTYFDFPLHFQKAEAAFGVGFEPSFTDISYAFTVALRRANLSVRNPNFVDIQPPKKEKNLPWWDDMRNYIHGNISLFLSETSLNIFATPDPYEKNDTLQIFTGHMEIHQSDGRIYVSSADFKVFASSLDTLLRDSNLNFPKRGVGPTLDIPYLTVEVIMEWGCDSGNPMNHYLFALPSEGVAREIIFDPFRSTSLSLRFDISLRSSPSTTQSQAPPVGEEAGVATVSDNCKMNSPTISVGTFDLTWLAKFCTIMYLPPVKLRTFSRWPRYGVPRIVRSGNLPMDKVMTEFMLRIDITPTCIRHVPLDDEDPAKGLTFKMEKLKYEMYFGRGKQIFTFDCKRDTLDLVYQGVDFHMPKAYLDKEACVSVSKVIQMAKRKISKSPSMDKDDKNISTNGSNEKHRDDGFIFYSDYFTIRKHSPKADSARLVAWQEAGRRNKDMVHVKSEFEIRSDGGEHTHSDPSDEDDYNVVVADSCQRVFVYGLKLLWTIENRDAVFSWIRGIGKAIQSKPSPSRQYAQRKLLEYNLSQKPEKSQDEISESPATDVVQSSDSEAPPSIVDTVEAENVLPAAAVRTGNNDTEEEGTSHFMVNIIEPQFNLHSEDANGRFLLAAASGRVLTRSFHAVVQVGSEMLEQALGTGGSMQIPEIQPEMAWNRMEFSVMLEHVQAHVAPTDVDPGAGLQWLPKIRKSSPKVKRTGALLENVFTPCDMFFRFTRHNGGTTDMKIKPLKELSFNCQNITATMTSRQFQVMLDVLTNLLFARVPKPRKSSLLTEEGEDMEEEADEVVPDGVEEVELARISLEQKEREQNMILFDIRMMSSNDDFSTQMNLEKEGNLWMIEGRRPVLVQKMKNELGNAKKMRKASSASLREALQKAAQLRLVEKEKNRTPSCAMRISVQINKVVWTLLADGKTFAEAEISDMIYDFDRDYKDFGVAKFTTKYFVARNCLPNAKFDMVLSPWNPPADWGKKVMLRVDVKQGAPKDGGNCPIENFQVEIYPLKIHLTEHLYHVVWGYLFPEEEQDSQRRQEVWKVSTTAGTKRAKKGSSVSDASSMGNLSKDLEVSSKTNPSSGSNKADSAQATKNKANATRGSNSELRRTASFDRTWEENVAESVADELVMQAQSSKMGSIGIELQDEPGKNKQKDNKTSKTGKAASQEEKKAVKQQDDKKTRPRRLREFRNVKISQVELLVTYEGPPLSFTELRLLMDTFQRVDFTGTWSRLFSRVKKHVIWGVLKSVTGMQGKKFKAASNSQKETPSTAVPDSENTLSITDGSSADKSSQNLLALAAQRSVDGAGDGFVTSVKGLFSTHRKKAKKFVLRTMRGEAENEFAGDWSDGDAEFSPFARQLTISKAKKLIRRHTKKFDAKGQKDSSEQSSPTGEMVNFEVSSSDESSADENEPRD